jgi:hypothetical protein
LGSADSLRRDGAGAARHRCRPAQLDLRRLGPRRGRAAAIYTLIETAKLNGVDPQAWLADVLARLPDHPARRIADLLPWAWASRQPAAPRP